MICTVPSLAHPDGLYPFLNRVSFPHNKTPKVFCPTFGVHYILAHPLLSDCAELITKNIVK